MVGFFFLNLNVNHYSGTRIAIFQLIHELRLKMHDLPIMKAIFMK